MKLEVNESIELMLLNESYAPEIYNLAKDIGNTFPNGLHGPLYGISGLYS
ncbi:MAG: hypothetical protein IPO45_02055 [Saprospiraceae bacterium]|nr:hypothetical protein [Candidatus Brachybacter algidus]